MRLPVLASALLATLSLAGCKAKEFSFADKGWVSLPAIPGNPGAAYFTVQGGTEPDILVGVSTSAATKSEMHDTVEAGGIARMRPIASVPIPVQGEVVFKPGGKHVMLFGLPRTLKAGDTVRLGFTFADSEPFYMDAPVQPAGLPAPEHEGH